MSNTATPQFLLPSAGEKLNVVGESIRVLADGQSTAGRLFIFEETSPAGNGPPLHRHTHDDEYFYIISGQFKFASNGQEFIATPGAFIAAPKGSTHTFVSCASDGQPSKMLIITTPPGLEAPFRATHAAGPNASMDQIIAAFAAFQLTFVGPPLAPPR